MAFDISEISIRFNAKRYKMPSFSKMKALLDSKSFAQDSLQLARPLLRPTSTQLSSKDMAEYYDREMQASLHDVLTSLTSESFCYQYLALSLDLEKLHDYYLGYFEHPGSRSPSERHEMLSGLQLYSEAKEELLALDARVKDFITSFEFFTLLDGLYFEKLKVYAESQSEFVQQFVALIIDGFNVSSSLRLQALKKHPSLAAKLLIDNPLGISKDRILSSVDHEVVKKFFGLKEIVSLERVDLMISRKKLSFLSQSILHGLGEEMLLFYIEVLKTFFYDLKLMSVFHELRTPKEQITNHLINYDLSL